MKRLIYSTLSVALLALASCEGLTGHSGQETDTIAQPADSTALGNGEKTVTGVVFDGSRRNIYMSAGSDTLDFELPPEIDFSWEIGDTITVKYVTTEYGDSVIGIGSAHDMAMR